MGSGMRSCSSFSLWSAWTSLTEKGVFTVLVTIGMFKCLCHFCKFLKISFYLTHCFLVLEPEAELSYNSKVRHKQHQHLSCFFQFHNTMSPQVSIHHPQAEVFGGSVCE